MDMQLPFEDLFLFPPLKYSKLGGRNRKDLEAILFKIFAIFEYDADLIIQFFTRSFNLRSKLKALEIAKKTEVSENEAILYGDGENDILITLRAMLKKSGLSDEGINSIFGSFNIHEGH
jgi:hypothetical protein